MKTLFNYIKARINAQVPSIKTVRYWNYQTDNSNGEKKDGRNEKAFPYPACFIELIFNGADNRCLRIVDYLITVRFRLSRQDYKYERLDQFDFADQFAACMQLMAPTPASGLTFTTFQESPRGTFEDEFNNVENFYIDYVTRFRYTAAYKNPILITVPLGLQNDPKLVAQIVPPDSALETEYSDPLETESGVEITT